MAARKTAAVAARPTDGPVRVILLTGLESERKNAEAHALLRLTDPDFADFDSETLDGSTAAANQILGAVASVAFGSGRRVVLVRDTQQLSADEQKQLAAGLDKIPAQSLLVLHTGAPVVEDGKTRKDSVIGTELANAVKKLGEVREFALPKADDLRGFLVAEAKKLGKALDAEALAALAQLPADDVRRVGSELEKAALHAGDNPKITVADVEATLSRSPDDVIFKLCDAVGARRPKEALQHVATLFRGSARPDSVAPRVLVMLARQIRLVAQFRYLGERRMAGRGASPITPEVATLLPSDGAASMIANTRTAWMADKYVAQARNFSGAELAERLEKLLNADLMLKGSLPGGENPQAVLQRLVVELC